MIFTLYGFVCMLAQFLLFPPVARRFGVLNCLRGCSLAFPILYLLIPYTVLLPTNLLRQSAIFSILVLKGWACVFAFPCSIIMLTNSASSLRVLGTLNGIATSVSAIGRAAGPALGGAAFTFGVKHGYVITPWWIFAAISALGAVPVFFIVEGDGFGGGSEDAEDAEHGADPESPVGSIAEPIDTKPDPRSDAGISSSAASSSSASRSRLHPASSSRGAGPDQRLSRVSTDRSVLDDETTASGVDDTRSGTGIDAQRGDGEHASQNRRPRRRSEPRESAISIGGAGVGRRLSSNLGQSFGGWGGPGSWEG